MAYLLRFDGVNDYVSIPAFALSSVGDYVETDVDIVNNEGYFFSKGIDAFSNILAYQNDRYRLRVGSSGAVSEIIAPAPVGRNKLRITLAGGGYDLSVNGQSLGIFVQPSGFSPEIIGAWSLISISTLDLYSVEVLTGGAISRFYDPTASFDQGELVDTASGNNGTPINFPANFNDALIFYDDGGGAVDVTGQTATYSYSPVSATVELTGAIEITGALASYSYIPISATIDLTGSIDVSGNTATYSYTAQPGTVDLTSAIGIQGATATYSYQSVNGSVELTGIVAVTGDTADYNYTPISGKVNLQGTVTITAESAQYTYSAVSASITLDSGLLITNYNAAFAADTVRAVFGKDNITARFR